MQPTFTRDGQYDLRSERKRGAAAIAALRYIACIPQAYHAQGPDYCVRAMREVAQELLEQIRQAAIPAPRERRLVDGRHALTCECGACRYRASSLAREEE